jgi:ABC-type branched-subunit amino acid transport system ATPase component
MRQAVITKRPSNDGRTAGAAVADEALAARAVTVRFGGVTAVNELSLEVPQGSLTGLIGPNGAGKSTFFNACTGNVRLASGRIDLFGSDVTRLHPSARARLGLGRTFQRMELFESMTVIENVRLGHETGAGGVGLIGALFSTPALARTVTTVAEEMIELCGLGAIRHAVVGTLPTGQKRLVELARTLAGQFRLLLLDEPSSGLDHDETRFFGEILRQVVADGKCSILLVEHDMDLVMNLCQYIYVLDFGELIHQGTPAETRSSEAVRAAYLGSAAIG